MFARLASGRRFAEEEWRPVPGEMVTKNDNRRFSTFPFFLVGCNGENSCLNFGMAKGLVLEPNRQAKAALISASRSSMCHLRTSGRLKLSVQ